MSWHGDVGITHDWPMLRAISHCPISPISVGRHVQPSDEAPWCSAADGDGAEGEDKGTSVLVMRRLYAPSDGPSLDLKRRDTGQTPMTDMRDTT